MGLFDIPGQIIQGVQQKKNISRTLEANKQLAKYQYSMDLDMWNRMNAYNDPKATMERLKNAGLNENLVYGTGSAANAAAPAPRYPDVRADYTSQMPLLHVPDFISGYQDIALKQAQIDNVKAGTKATEAKTVTEGLRAIVQGLMPEKLKADTLKTKRDSVTSLYRQQTELDKGASLRLQNELQTLLNPLLLDYQKSKNKAVDLDNQKRVEDVIFRQFENQWRQMGVTSSDNFILRAIARYVMQSGTFDKVIQFTK